MLKENHISTHKSWRNSLDELTVLPGESVQDLDKYWEKLQLKLVVKKEYNTGNWIRLAAACLFFMLITLLVNAPGKISTAENWKEENEQLTVEYPQTLPYLQNKLPLETATKKANGDRYAILKKAAKKDSVLVSTVVLPEEKMPVKDVFVSLSDSQFIKDLQKEKTMLVRSLKKKMPIVHINDLEMPTKTPDEVAGSSERPVFKVRFFSRNIISNSFSPALENGNLFKIKISPQN